MSVFRSRFKELQRRVPIDEHNCAVQFDETKCKNCTLHKKTKCNFCTAIAPRLCKRGGQAVRRLYQRDLIRNASYEYALAYAVVHAGIDKRGEFVRKAGDFEFALHGYGKFVCVHTHLAQKHAFYCGYDVVGGVVGVA